MGHATLSVGRREKCERNIPASELANRLLFHSRAILLNDKSNLSNGVFWYANRPVIGPSFGYRWWQIGRRSPRTPTLPGRAPSPGLDEVEPATCTGRHVSPR